MEETREIQEILDMMSQREHKTYDKMKIEEISQELRNAMEFEQKMSQKIESMEKKGIKSDLTDYARMVCKNTIEREISEIQEAYLAKIDKTFLSKSK